MVKAKCINIDLNNIKCSKQASCNYENEPPRYCSLHKKSRLVNNKTQRMGNVSKPICTIGLCSKNLCNYNKTLFYFL